MVFGFKAGRVLVDKNFLRKYLNLIIFIGIKFYLYVLIHMADHSHGL